MRKILLTLMMMWTGAALAHDSVSQVPAQSSQPTASSPQPVRPIGVVTQIQTGSFTLHTDSGADLIIMLPDGAAVQRVPPGAKDLNGDERYVALPLIGEPATCNFAESTT